MSGLRVSVVAATHNRAHSLRLLLAALRAQTLATDSFEVVIVDDGSADETPTVLAAEAGDGVLRLRSLQQEPSRGPAAARNRGWREAVAPLVAFTDDDCVPDPRWLEELLAAHGDRPGLIVQGATEPDPARAGAIGPFTRTVRVTGPSPYFETCNIAYPRSLLERLGGFDEVFPGAAGEDAELGHRAVAAGAERVFASRALVHHAVEEAGPKGMLRRAVRVTDEVPAFGASPELRALLTNGVFYKASHAHLLQSAAAVALAFWFWPSLLFALPYALHLRGRLGLERARLRHLPFLILFDAVETAATVRGAVRHRIAVI